MWMRARDRKSKLLRALWKGQVQAMLPRWAEGNRRSRMQSARRVAGIAVALAVISTLGMARAENAEIRMTTFHVEGMT